MVYNPNGARHGRNWERTRHWTGTEFVIGHKINCKEVGCTEYRILPDRGVKQIPVDQVELRLRREGWDVGKKSSRDKCPKCVQKEMDAKRMKHSSLNAPARLVVDNSNNGEPDVAQAATAPSAQELTRDSRRIIMVQLEDVYESEEKGYKAPWTDQAVAKHLGVPVAWVVALREEFFGPARDNDEIRALQEEIAVANKLLGQSIASVEQLTKDAASISGKLLNAKGAMESAQRTLDVFVEARRRHRQGCGLTAHDLGRHL